MLIYKNFVPGIVDYDKVSIIIPAYNAEATIGETIDSVRNQTYQNWELIVVDDCSFDGTRDVVNTYIAKDDRIRLCALDKNNGAPAAPRNIGVQIASGEWIALLDADDIWHPKKLELQLQIMIEAKSDFCCTQMLDFREIAEITFATPEQIYIQKISFSQQQIKGRIPASSVLLRRRLLLQFPFNEAARYKAVEDYHCWLRILEETGPAIKLAYPLLRYRKSAEQISKSKIKMLQRVYMVHREYPRGSALKALVLMATHALGAFYFRILKRKL